MRQTLWCSLRIVVADHRDTAGWNAGVVVIRMVDIRSQRHRDRHSILVRRVDLRVVRIDVIRLVRIGHVIRAERWTTLTAAAGWNHPAKELVSQSSVLVAEAHRLSLAEIPTGRTRPGIDRMSKQRDTVVAPSVSMAMPATTMASTLTWHTIAVLAPTGGHSRRIS